MLIFMLISNNQYNRKTKQFQGRTSYASEQGYIDYNYEEKMIL